MAIVPWRMWGSGVPIAAMLRRRRQRSEHCTEVAVHQAGGVVVYDADNPPAEGFSTGDTHGIRIPTLHEGEEAELTHEGFVRMVPRFHPLPRLFQGKDLNKWLTDPRGTGNAVQSAQFSWKQALIKGA